MGTCPPPAPGVYFVWEKVFAMAVNELPITPQRDARSPDPDRIGAEVERLAAGVDRMRARLGPGDAPDLLAAIIRSLPRAHG